MKSFQFLNALTATPEAGSQMNFQPSNFLTNLKYMGLGMLIIFVVIGIIILITMMINKFFAD